MGTLSRRRFLQISAGAALGSAATRLTAQTAGLGPYGVPEQWDWRLRIEGEVAHPRLYDLQDMMVLPTRFMEGDLRAREGGSVSRARWEGVHLSTLIQAVQPSPEAQYVHVHCADGHRDCYTVADLMRPRALFATTRNLRLLLPDQGGPCRLVIPWRLAERSAVAIVRLEFQREPVAGCDPLRSLLSAADEGWFSPPPAALGEGETLVTEIPGQPAGPPTRRPWDPARNPPSDPDPGKVAGYVRNLFDPSFTLGNGSRTSLALLGSISDLDPARADSPVTTYLLDARIYAQDVLAAVDSEESTAWAVSRLSDPSALVQAMALETAARRRSPAALPAALDCLSHPDPGLAQVAIVAAGALASPGDAGVVGRLESARGAASDATRLALIERALGAVAAQ